MLLRYYPGSNLGLGRREPVGPSIEHEEVDPLAEPRRRRPPRLVDASVDDGRFGPLITESPNAAAPLDDVVELHVHNLASGREAGAKST